MRKSNIVNKISNSGKINSRLGKVLDLASNIWFSEKGRVVVSLLMLIVGFLLAAIANFVFGFKKGVFLWLR